MDMSNTDYYPETTSQVTAAWILAYVERHGDQPDLMMEGLQAYNYDVAADIERRLRLAHERGYIEYRDRRDWDPECVLTQKGRDYLASV